jgi:hypothetical protein
MGPALKVNNLWLTCDLSKEKRQGGSTGLTRGVEEGSV